MVGNLKKQHILIISFLDSNITCQKKHFEIIKSAKTKI
jgi:hypothetical protein